MCNGRCLLQGVLLSLSLLSAQCQLIEIDSQDDPIPQYTFKEYSYNALPKYETFFQEYQAACQQSPSCQTLDGVQRLNCIRECISPACYIEIYHSDKLENGEVDVRLDSFKGCLIQRRMRH